MEPVTERAFILLATHNGERFVREQIDSLQAQSWTDWRLLIQDDHSTDETVAIVQSLAAADPRISFLSSAPERRGAAATFAALVGRALELSASYAFFCDQDDVWLPHKLETEMRAMLAAEKAAEAGTPVLVHSDLKVVDESLRAVHPSYREFNGVSYDRDDPLSTLALHNAVVGCTAGFNRPLMTVALPVPAGTYHDWWFAQCAAASGRIVDCAAPTVLYRQHSTNVIGARGRHAFIPQAFRQPRRFVADAFAAFRTGVTHAFALERRMAERPGLFDAAARARVEKYCSAFRAGSGIVTRLRRLASSGVHPRRLVSYGALYTLVAVYPHVRD